MKRLLFAASLVAAATAALAGDNQGNASIGQPDNHNDGRNHLGIGVMPVPAHTSPV